MCSFSKSAKRLRTNQEVCSQNVGKRERRRILYGLDGRSSATTYLALRNVNLIRDIGVFHLARRDRDGQGVGRHRELSIHRKNGTPP